MPRSSTLTKTTGDHVITKQTDTTEEKRTQNTARNIRGNVMMRPITPEMYDDPQPLDFADEWDSREFTWEKCFRLILEPLKFKTEKDWLSFASEVWDWMEAEELRRKQAIVKDILATYHDDEVILRMLKDEVEAIAA